MSFHTIIAVIALCSGLAAVEPAGAAWTDVTRDRIPDSSFECGHDWWSLERAVYLDAGGGTAWLPAIDDPEQPWHGALSLRIDNPRGDAWQLASGDVELEPGVDYECSFSARAGVAGTVLGLGSVGRENDHWGRAGSGSWKLETTWKRYVATLRAAPGHRWFNLRFASDGQGAKTGTGTVWLDAVQLRRAPVAGYEPPSIEAGVREPARFYALDSRGPWPVDLRVRNHAAGPRRVVAAWVVVDTADGREVAAGRSDTVAVAGTATAGIGLEVSPRRRGSFDLRCQVFDAGSGERLAWLEHGFALVDPVPPPATVLTGGFAIGAQFSIRADWAATDWSTRSTVMLRGCSLEDQIDYRVATGESWVRAWDFRWAPLEPTEGGYDWRLTDLLVDACAARGVGVMASTNTLLTEDRPQSRYSRAPEWAQQRWPPRAGSGSMACQLCPVPPAAWARHLGAAAARYAGKVAVWEIMNEPNLWLSAEEYAAYLRAASTAIRAADPRALVAGICATGDLGGRLVPFLDGCAERGALDLVDAITFHPYHARQDSSPHPADRAIAELRDLLAARGKPDLPLWNSELFYLQPRPGQHEYWSYIWQSGTEVARRHLTDLAGGVMRSACVESSTYCQRTQAARSWDDRSRKPVPNRQFVALNTLARLAGGAHSAPGGITSGPGRLHRITRADGSPLAAAWSADPEEAALLLRLPGAVGRITVLDTYGNPAPTRSEGDDLLCELGTDPLYLLPATAGDAAGFVAGAVITFRDPWSLIARGSASPTGQPVLVVAATSRLETSLGGKVQTQVRRGDRVVAQDERRLELAGRATTSWTVALEAGEADAASLDARIRAAPGGVDQVVAALSVPMPPIATCPTLVAAPAIDGSVEAAEWAGAGSVDFPRGDRVGNWLAAWRGVDDCSGGLRLGIHQGWLFVAAQVRDDARGHSARDAKSAWNRDAIELFFDLRPDQDWQDTGYAGRGGQLMIGLPQAEGGLLIRDGGASLKVAERVRSAWRTVPGGWCLELAIPLDGRLAGLQPGAVLGFGAVLNDADDDAGARTRLFWAGDRMSWTDRSALGRLVVR